MKVPLNSPISFPAVDKLQKITGGKVVMDEQGVWLVM